MMRRLAPYVMLSALFCALELRVMMRGTALEAAFDISLGERLALILRNLSFYVSKSVFPSDLTFVVPRWDLDALALRDLAPLLLWAGAVCGVLVRRPAWWRGFVAGQAELPRETPPRRRAAATPRQR